MKFSWAVWSFGIALAALVCYADEPEKTTTRSRVMTKQSNEPPINLTYPGCGKRPSESGRTPQLINKRINKRDSELGVSSSREKGEVLNISKDGEEKPEEKRPLIVGGVEAVPHSWPWMAALHIEKGGIYFCGGSLISEYYVLTAGHCVYNNQTQTLVPASNIQVILGAHNSNNGTEYAVSQVTIHQDFEYSPGHSDIALLRLAKGVQLSNHIYPVCLPSDDLKGPIIPNQTNVTITGWGLKENETGVETLREVTLQIISSEICNPTANSEDNVICLKVTGGKSNCQGDSGGPMVLEVNNNTWVQVGIISAGETPCEEEGNHAYHTRVSSYTRWLYENTDLGKSLSLKLSQ